MYALNIEDVLKRDRRTVRNLSIDPTFFRFVEEELLSAIDFDATAFWSGLEKIIDELTPMNRQLLHTRDKLQQEIDDWHKARKDTKWNHTEYLNFLREIDYLTEPGEPFAITTANVDEEIAIIAGPQLVVPVNNARFAINAASRAAASLAIASCVGTSTLPPICPHFLAEES